MIPSVHTASTAAPVRAARATGRSPRALVWDSQNSSSILAARSFVRLGWAVDWMGSADSPWSRQQFWSSRTVVDKRDDASLQRIFHQHPLDALLLHGDDQVRWVLRHWRTLPNGVHRHLPPAESLVIGLSKQKSMDHARALGVPVLDTILCSSRSDVAAAAEQLGARKQLVVKGEGISAGAAVHAVRTGTIPSDAIWHAVTRHSPTVMVQKRIHGPRYLVTVVYDHGVERAACVHEKTVAFPVAFGPAAFGVTHRVDILHDYAARLFESLQWHGIADVEFRQDLDDGRWHFMEINPRVCATLGIQERAGQDVAGTWAQVCDGRGEENAPGRNYRDGVRYAWTVRAIALMLKSPWRAPVWGLRCLLSPDSDREIMDPAVATQALRAGLWTAGHE